MAQQKSKYTQTLYIRITEACRAWAQLQIPKRFSSFSAYVDHLIHKDKIAEAVRVKTQKRLLGE